MDDEYPGRVLIAEANQWPEDVRAYFGDGDEFHMCFHFPVMPRLYMSLKRADKTPILDILAQTPEIPKGTQWLTFLRNHDELTLEMVTPGRDHEWVKGLLGRINLGRGRARAQYLLDLDDNLICLWITKPGSLLKIRQGIRIISGSRLSVRI